MTAAIEADGRMKISWANEADIQQGVAEVAWAAGWLVQREVHVPGWGRVDLVLDCNGWSWAVELKVDLTRPRDIRRALQQADGYSRSLPVAQVLLVAPTLGVDVAQYAAAYPSVKVLGLSAFMGLLQQPDVPGNLLRAIDRAADADRLQTLSQAVLSRLDGRAA